jgi:hypothetical protein
MLGDAPAVEIFPVGTVDVRLNSKKGYILRRAQLLYENTKVKVNVSAKSLDKE